MMNTQIKEQEIKSQSLITTPSIVTKDIGKNFPQKSQKKSRPVSYKITYADNFKEVFNDFLYHKKQSDIEMKRIYPNWSSSFVEEITPSKPRVKTFFIKQVYKIMMESLNNPKLDANGNIIGVHIPRRSLDALIKNPLYKYFNFFRKGEGSTYHANNAKYGKSNGYCHWYTFSTELFRIRRTTSRRLRKALTFVKNGLDKEYNKDVKTYTRAPKSFVFDAVNYCRIELDPFLMELDLFDDLQSDTFAMVLTHVKYFDNEYVYIDNTCKKKNELENTLGREYSVVGLMKKEMRERLFRGYLEVDLSCANQNLMLNLFSLKTTNKEKDNLFKDLRVHFPEIFKMFENKIIFRSKIAHAFKTNSDNAKTIIQHISHDPKSRIVFTYLIDASETGKGVGNKIPQTIAKAYECIKPLVKDATLLQGCILRRFYDQATNDDFYYKFGNLTIGEIPRIVDEAIKLKNTKLKGNGKGKRLASRRYAQIYFLIENQVRKCMIEYVERMHFISGGIDIYQIHDAIIFKNRVLKGHHEIVDSVKANLGFEIELTTKVLGRTH